jgi:hypothetical protein
MRIRDEVIGMKSAPKPTLEDTPVIRVAAEKRPRETGLDIEAFLRSLKQ